MSSRSAVLPAPGADDVPPSVSATPTLKLDCCHVEPLAQMPDKSKGETEAVERVEWVPSMMGGPQTPEHAMRAWAWVGRLLVDSSEFWLGKKRNVTDTQVGSSSATPDALMLTPPAPPITAGAVHAPNTASGGHQGTRWGRNRSNLSRSPGLVCHTKVQMLALFTAFLAYCITSNP